MSIEQAIEENTRAISELTVVLRSFVISSNAKPVTEGFEPATMPTEPPEKKTRKKKAEVTEALPATPTVIPAEITASNPLAGQTAPPVATPTEPIVGYDAVKEAVYQSVLMRGHENTLKVLESLGVAHASSLKPEQYVDAVAKLKVA